MTMKTIPTGLGPIAYDDQGDSSQPAHVRRRFYELAKAGASPVATDVLTRIARLYTIEAELRGRSPDERRTERQECSRFLDDGRVELDSNAGERAIHLLALNRKNALFAGSDDGGDHWAVIASLIETAKLNGVDPQAWLADTLSRPAAGHPATALDALMPWHYTHDVA